MATTKPTILIAHGSCHQPAHFAKQISLLQAHGYEALYDTAVIKSVLSKLVEEEGKDVIMLLHSYGGLVGTESVTEERSKRFCEKKGLAGGVVKLLYICAFLLHKGESLNSAFGGEFPSFIPVEADGTCNMLNPQHNLYHDLSPSEQEHWTSLLRPIPVATQTTTLTNEAYRYVSTTYLVCDDDQIMPVSVQEQFVKNAEVEIQTQHCTAGHSPFLSVPERVVEVIEGLRW